MLKLEKIGFSLAFVLDFICLMSINVFAREFISHETQNYDTMCIRDVSCDDDFTVNSSGVLIKYSGCAREVKIPDRVKEISYGVFMDKSEIEAVIFSKNLVSIDENAFYGCIHIKKIILPESLENIGRLAFGNCRDAEFIYFGKNIKNLGLFILCKCKKLSYISVNGDNKNYTSYNGILCTKDMKQLICCPENYSGEVKLDGNIAIIKAYAFYNCVNVTKLYDYGSLTYIDEAAFYGCKNLREVNFGNKIKKIRSGAFEKCTSLIKVVIPRSVTEIGNRVFADCNALREIIFLSENLEIGNKIFPCMKKIIVYGYLNSSVQNYASHHDLIFKSIS